MPVPTRVLTTAVCSLALLAISIRTSSAQTIHPVPRAGDQAVFGVANTERAHQLLTDMAAKATDPDDYYFVLVGDIQNNVRSLRRDVFESIAAEVRVATDEHTGAPIYDRIRFVILLGDLVYEGPSTRQWVNLEGTFAGRNSDKVPYPNIAQLVKDKAVFPAIGNHELLEFAVRPQTRYRAMFDSPVGVLKFKQFFGWDRFIANPRMLYPVPSDLSDEMFRFVLARTSDFAGRDALTSSYETNAEGRHALKFLKNPPLDAGAYSAEKGRLAALLAPIFRGAGYGTLPVVSSDNMIAYGVDAGDTVYILLDSMSRGWQYPNFSELKKKLYPDKKDQHRLNLYSESPFNGQGDFFKAVADYARTNGKTIVPMMHHSFISGTNNLHDKGLAYNHWLGLGLPQTPSESGDPTIFDEILFSDASHFFSACAHGFETFSIVSKQPGQPDHTLHWTISGGGGGPLRKAFYPDALVPVAQAYNQKLSAIAGSTAGRSIEITDEKWKIANHFLVVHVRHGKIEEVTPHFLPKSEIPRPRAHAQFIVKTSEYSGPASFGAAMEFSPGTWGLEKIRGYLAFANWRPTISVGVISDAAHAGASSGPARAFVAELSPLNVDVYIPRSKLVTLRMPGVEIWTGSSGRRRAFATMGLEAPIVWDLFGRARNVILGVKVLAPLGSARPGDQGFGRSPGFSVSIGYRLLH